MGTLLRAFGGRSPQRTRLRVPRAGHRQFDVGPHCAHPFWPGGCLFPVRARSPGALVERLFGLVLGKDFGEV